MTTIVIPTWFAVFVAAMFALPLIGMALGVSYGAHFCYLRYFKPFRWMRKFIHLF